MKKIIATDFDGTLNQGGIQPHVVEAIERFRKAGNLFGVVTGRDRGGSIDAFLAEKKFGFDFVLALNGAMAFDGEGNHLYSIAIDGSRPVGDTTLSRALLRRVWELTGFHAGVALEEGRMDIHPDHPEGAQIKWAVTDPFEDLEKDVFARMNSFLQVNTICESEERAGEVTAILQKEFGQYVNPLQNGICIDIPAAGLDKGEGVARYAAMMGVRDEDIWTAGDNYNDIAMLERFRGCAMTRGTEAAKAVSKHVCWDIAEVVDLAMADGSVQDNG